LLSQSFPGANKAQEGKKKKKKNKQKNLPKEDTM
jgi:hypothetical protein